MTEVIFARNIEVKKGQLETVESVRIKKIIICLLKRYTVMVLPFMNMKLSREACISVRWNNNYPQSFHLPPQFLPNINLITILQSNYFLKICSRDEFVD